MTVDLVTLFSDLSTVLFSIMVIMAAIWADTSITYGAFHSRVVFIDLATLIL